MYVILRKTLIAAWICLCCAAGSAQTNFATLATDGAWTWFNDPRALFHNGTLYFGFVRNSDGLSALNAFNPQTGVSTNLWGSALVQRDDHNNPGLLVKQDGRLLAIHARHGTDQYFSYRYSFTTNPVSPGDWSSEQTIAATGSGVTYANPFQLAGESGKIYNFTRNLNFNPTVLTSTNGGTNWSAPQLFIRNGTGSIRPYVKYSSNYTNRIDFLYTDGHPRDVTNSLYHMFYQAGNLFKTEGTLLKSYSAIPVLHDSGERGSVIYQYSTAATVDPNQHIPTGRAWCWETAYQTNGDPVCLFTVQRDQVTGTNWFDARIYYYYARWTGTNWQKRFIAHAGRPLYSSEADYAGGICLDPEDVNTIYISSNAADPFNLSNLTNVALRANDRYELWKGTTADGGLTFTWKTVTTNSAFDNLRPYVPRRHNGQRAVIWFRGTYSTYTTYNCSVVGLFPNPVPTSPSVTITNPAGRPVILTNANNKLKLGGTAVDDGLPGPFTLNWSTITGPTNAIFSDASSAETTVEFPMTGSYTLRLTANDSVLSGWDEVTVHVGTAAPGNEPSLAAWLKLDETSGITAGDSSNSGNSGALTGGANWLPTGGKREGALDFDGSIGQVTVNDADSLDSTSAFTLAYWFRADSYPPDSAGLVSKRDGPSVQNAYTTYLKTADQRIYVDVDNANNRFASGTPIQLGVWYHVGVVFDGSLTAANRVKLWINGALDVTASESSVAIPNYTSHLRLGNTHSGAPNWFDGRIDDVRFYRRALNATEIAWLGAGNFAPSVTTGPAPAATNAVAAILNGSVIDDAYPAPLSAHWSKFSGPGSAFFSNASQPATSVTFNQAGSYTLQLTATDTEVEVLDRLVINVAPNPKVYEDWIAAAFPEATNAALLHITGDPDGDGVKNLIEFGLGMVPSTHDAIPFTQTQPGLPLGLIMAFGGTNYLAMRVRRPAGLLGIAYAAEVSTNFADWYASIEEASTPNGDGTEVAVFRDVQPAELSPMKWMRLKLTKL